MTTRIQPERFWAKVIRGDGCWEWQGTRLPPGYGRFGRLYAHRLSWEMAFGEIPEGLSVCHHCDNPPCVRLSHLFLGTAQDNVDDSIRKGRRAAGAPAHADLVRQLLAEWDEIDLTGGAG